MKKRKAPRKIWIEIPDEVLAKLDVVANRDSRSRQKQVGVIIAQAVKDVELPIEARKR